MRYFIIVFIAFYATLTNPHVTLAQTTSQAVPTLGVALDASTPASATVTAGATNVSFASIKVTAGAQPVNTLNAIQVGSDSPNAVKALTNFKIYDGPTLLSSSSLDLNYNGAYYYQWLKVSGFSIPANTSKTLTVVSDVKSGAPTGQVRLGIAGWNFDSPGALVEPFGTPLYGNQMSIVSASTTVAVVSPNGGEVWRAGEIRRVTWKTQGLRLVRIYIEDATIISSGAAIYITPNNEPVTAAQGYYDWTIPPLSQLPGGAGSSNYRIRVVDYDNPNVSDSSDAPFTVSGAVIALAVTSPRGGEVWEKGQAYALSWTYAGISFVNLSVFKDGVFVQYIAQNLPVDKNQNAASYPWVVPVNLAAGSGYQIYVSAPLDANATSASDAFHIIDNPEFTVECLPDGTLIKMPNDPKVYVIERCQKHWIRTAEEFERGGYAWKKVKPVEPTVVQSYADDIRVEARLVRAIGDQKVYRIVNGKRLWVPTAEAFRAQGLKWENVKQSTASETARYPHAKLLKAAGDDRIYHLTQSGLKRPMVSPDVFLSYGNHWEDVVEVTPTDLGAYADNTLVRREGDTKIYALENGLKRWIATPDIFRRYQLDWTSVASVNDTEFSAYPEGPALR